MASESFQNAKINKNDEFYTQYEDIEKEINAYYEYNKDVFRNKTILCPCDDPEWSNFTKYFSANFERFGLKKLISTSYAKSAGNQQLSLFEEESPKYDKYKHDSHGKIFVLERDIDNSGKIDHNDIEFEYLNGDGDFNSEEVKLLRDEADIIITNPPFSLFREFMNWILEANKKFAIIGNMNALNYREIFPNVKANKIWIGGSGVVAKTYLKPDGSFQKMGNTCWFTNIEHGKRHKPLQNLTTMDGNIKHSKHKEIRGKGYIHYDNYDAIEVPYTDAIPTDYDGIMGVPISFLDKYCPEQFEIIWRSHDIDWVDSECDFFTYPTAERLAKFKKADKTWRVQIPYMVDENDNAIMFYQRIFIKRK